VLTNRKGIYSSHSQTHLRKKKNKKRPRMGEFTRSEKKKKKGGGGMPLPENQPHAFSKKKSTFRESPSKAALTVRMKKKTCKRGGSPRREKNCPEGKGKN